jgi:uncharacterized membrane protein
MSRPAQKWNLAPYRSLGSAGRKAVLGGTAAVSVIMAGSFAAAGLWPMIPFAMIPPVGLAFGLAASNRSGRAWQSLVLDDDNMHITSFEPGWILPRTVTIPSGWMKVETVMAKNRLPDEEEERCEKILLVSGGRRYEIGAFLPPVEKLSLAADLRRALAARRVACPPPPAP